MCKVVNEDTTMAERLDALARLGAASSFLSAAASLYANLTLGEGGVWAAPRLFRRIATSGKVLTERFQASTMFVRNCAGRRYVRCTQLSSSTRGGLSCLHKFVITFWDLDVGTLLSLYMFLLIMLVSGSRHCSG